MTNDTLDEAIDRVAATMTAVSADDGFHARFDAQLRAARRFELPWIGLAAATAAAAAIFVALNLSSTTSPLPVVSTPSVASAIPVVPDVKPSTAAPIEELNTTSVPPARIDVVRVVPMIAALPHPAEIGVDDLSLNSLTIAPVEVGLLDLANLEVTGIDGGVVSDVEGRVHSKE